MIANDRKAYNEFGWGIKRFGDKQAKIEIIFVLVLKIIGGSSAWGQKCRCGGHAVYLRQIMLGIVSRNQIRSMGPFLQSQ